MAIYIWLLSMATIYGYNTYRAVIVARQQKIQSNSLREKNKQVEKSIHHNDRLISSKEDIEACKRSSYGQRRSLRVHKGVGLKLEKLKMLEKNRNGTGVGEGRK